MRLKFREFQLLVGFALSLFSTDGHGWGEEGHRLVGNIASRFLSSPTLERISQILQDDRLADGSPSFRRSLGEISSWADEIRAYPWGKERGAWHFDNVPVCGTAKFANYCPDSNCASAQLRRQIEILRNLQVTQRERNEALKWIVHLVGDIHQPLHAANNNDQGGNAVTVSFFGQKDNPPYGRMNLHAIWDVHMVTRLISERGGERSFVSTTINERDKFTWERGDIQDWIDESNSIAKVFAYGKLPAFSCEGQLHDIDIGETYYSDAAGVIEKQLTTAGVRLAKLLNAALGD